MMSNQNLSVWLWEQTEDKLSDNIKHKAVDGKVPEQVNLVSVPIEANKLSVSDDGSCPECITLLKSNLQFKGNIRLSKSGTSWNIFKNGMKDAEDDLVVINLSPAS